MVGLLRICFLSRCGHKYLGSYLELIYAKCQNSLSAAVLSSKHHAEDYLKLAAPLSYLTNYNLLYIINVFILSSTVSKQPLPRRQGAEEHREWSRRDRTPEKPLGCPCTCRMCGLSSELGNTQHRIIFVTRCTLSPFPHISLQHIYNMIYRLGKE